LKVQKTDNETESVKIATPDGTVVDDQNKKQLKTWVFEETIVERPDLKKRATILKRTYSKATVVVDKENVVLPYQGKTIVIERKKDGKYSFKFDGGAEITGKDAEFLDQEFNQDGDDDDLEAILLPRKAVAINEAWKIPMPEFLKTFEKQAKMSIVNDKATGTGKLVKAFKKDGRLYGNLVITLDLPIKALKLPTGDLPCKEGAVLTVIMKATSCIDGSISDEMAEWGVNLKGSASIPADNPMGVLNFVINRVSEGTSAEAKKK
ncbi:MAG TPA: hypothetical protein VE988_29385, partial [Gemmataceae bacterium]|nr:hypothetical protein [Gemmataceae bacterium]